MPDWSVPIRLWKTPRGIRYSPMGRLASHNLQTQCQSGEAGKPALSHGPRDVVPFAREMRKLGPSTTTVEDLTKRHHASSPPPESPSRQPKPISLLTRIRIWTVRAFLVSWIRCFSLSGLHMLGRIFGTLEFAIDYNRRRRVDRKLQSFFKDEFSPAWRRRTTWQYFMRIRCDKMFYTIMDRIPRHKLMNRIKRIGWENLDDALKEGKGVYFALCHFGSHHVAGLIMALLGYELAGVRDAKESPVRRYIQEKYRETFPEVSGVKLFHATSFPRDIYRHLKNNGILASLLDADRKRGEQTRTSPATIFGEEREILIGPIQMAIRCGATTLQGFVVSRPNFYYQLIVTPPLIDPKTVTDESETIANVIQRYADGVERFAREHPDHLMNI